MAEYKKSPIHYARVGSTIYDGKVKLVDFLEGNISGFHKGSSNGTFMSGNSRNVHGEMMNKGSFGISGSYGLAAGSKIAAAASGYVGNSVAASSNSVSLNYNAYMLGGIEYLKTSKLKIEDLIHSLAGNPKKSLLKVLDNYLHLTQLLENESILEALEAGKDEEIKKALKTWVNSQEDFFSSYGDLLIVAIHWGAYGFVNLKITSNDKASNWKYGGEADFSYASMGSSLSLKAAYEGSQSSSLANVSVYVDSFKQGDAIKQIIKDWRTEAEGKALKDLFEINLLNKVPALEVPENRRPTIPDFEKPKPESKEEREKLTNKLAQIKDLSGLQTFAVAQAYDKRSKEDEDLTLGEFIARGKSKVNEDKVTEIQKAIVTPSYIEVFDNDDTSIVTRNRMNRMNMMEEIESNNDSSQNESRSQGSSPEVSKSLEGNFVPLGLLAVSLSDIFPWLARGFDNRMEGLEEVHLILKWRNMIQDFQSLAILYYTAHECGLEIPGNATALSIADSFRAKSLDLQGKKDVEEYLEVMKRVFKGLSKEVQAIFKVYAKTPFLRQAELGLGLVSLYNNELTNSIGSIGNQSSGDWGTIATAVFKKCNFDKESKNYEVFASFIKLFPIIFPDGRICAFSNKGYYGGFSPTVQTKGGPGFHPKISDSRSSSFPFTETTTFMAFQFIADEQNSCLVNGSYRLYSIPFKAAKGIKWKGVAAGSACLGSFEDLDFEIKKIKKEMSELTKYSYSGDVFKGVSDLSNIGLSDLMINEHYIGIIEEPENDQKIFGNRKS